MRKKTKQCRRRHPRISVQVLDSNWRAGQNESVCETLVPALGRTCSDVPEGWELIHRQGGVSQITACRVFFYFIFLARTFFFFKKNSRRTVLLMDHDFHSSRVIFFLSLWRDRERNHSAGCSPRQKLRDQKLQIIKPPPTQSLLHPATTSSALAAHSGGLFPATHVASL